MVLSVVVFALLATTAVVVGSGGQEVSAASSDNFYLVAGNGGSPATPQPTGSASTSVGFASPSAVASDANGNPIVADTLNNEIDLVVEGSASRYDISGIASPAVGETYVLAGGGSTNPTSSGVAATLAALNAPAAVTVDPTGNVLIADTFNNEVEVIAETISNPGYVISGTWIRGDLYVIAGGGGGGTPTVGGLVATSSTLNEPADIAVDPSGNIVIADSADGEIDLLVTHLAGSGIGRIDGDVYVISGGGSGGQPTATGIVSTNAQLSTPKGVAVDSFGNEIIADTNHNAVDVVASSSVDPGYGIGAAWVIGHIYRIVGGGSTAATTFGVVANQSQLYAPQGLAVDSNGDLLIADVHHNALDVLAISSSNPGYALAASASWITGELYEIAGGGLSNASAGGSIANQTHLYAPIGVASLPDGSVATIDQGSKLLGRLLLSPSMTLSPSVVAGDSSVTLNWVQPVSTGGSTILDYVVSVFDHGGTLPINTIDLGSTSTTTTVSSLTNGVAYDFSIEASNAVGTSVASVEISATPVGPATVTITPPTTVPPDTVLSAAPTQVQISSPASGPSVPTVSARPRVTMLRENHRVNAHGFSFALRCRSGTCQGSITVTERHEVTEKSSHGSITVIEVSVIARGSYRESSKSTKTFHIPLTSFGRRALSSISGKGVAAVTTVTAHGGPRVVSHLHLF